MKLICLPCAGASASMYFHWKQFLPAYIDLCPVELAGRGTRLAEGYIEQFDKQVDDLFQRLFINNQSSKDSYILFGHSMGALLSYGLVTRIDMFNKYNRKQYTLNLPSAVIISAFAGPSVSKNERYEDLSESKLIDDLKAKNGTPKIIFEHQDLLDMSIATLRADYKICRSFKHSSISMLNVPIYVFYGKKDDISLKDLKKWQSETTAPITMHGFEGDHFYLKSNQCEKQMLKRLVDIVSDFSVNDNF